MLRVLIILVLSFCTSAYADLYTSLDHVVILKSENFNKEIFGAKNGWIIEFYNSWCGHCISFAPTWKNFSAEVTDWAHTIKVGVMDCSDEENIAICRDYEVMGYPSIRIFGSHLKKGDTGTNVEPRTIPEIQTSIVNFISEEQEHGRGSQPWVNLCLYNNSIGKIFKYAPTEARHAVLIVESAKVPLSGTYTILDLGKYSTVYIRRMKEGGTNEITGFGLSKYPALIIVKRDGTREIFNEKLASREQMTSFILKHLKLNDTRQGTSDLISNKSGSGYSNSLQDKEEGEGAGDGQPDEISSDRLSYDDDLPDSAYRRPIKDQVYMVDMENAISYALRSEVALHQVIRGEHLNALKKFLDALVEFLPARPQVHQFLVKLRNYVAKSRQKLTAEDLSSALRFISSSSSVLPDVQSYQGCRGSASHLRGYPCGLWTLFHTLTVNALLTSNEKINYDPHRPLRAIHGYVKYFFSCQECSGHFQDMYALDAESSVRVPNDEVLWLWSAHNKANKRLKGELSEDPTHPKIQFPAKSSCPSCWTGETSNQNKVLIYLKQIYGRGSLSLENTQVLTQETRENKQSKVMQPVGQKFLGGLMPGRDESISVVKMNSWGLNSVDINLCILLYFSSTVIIAAGYLMFILKRKLRRRKYLELYKLP